MSVFGFSTETSKSEDFLPILKYDARAGRFFRIDRIDTGQGFTSEPADITQSFKALADFENVEVGWIEFTPGSAPNFVLVPMGNTLPNKPSDKHKNGLRMMIKLAKDCGGDKPVRELAGTSKAFLSGIEAVYLQYLEHRAANPGKLPVLALDKTMPIKTGTGEKTSTNYTPVFKIIGWAVRGDLKFVPKAALNSAMANVGARPAANGAAPNTGSVRAAPPAQVSQAAAVSADDFG